jgi:uncharacterized protein YbjT (DUF2867 family)
MYVITGATGKVGGELARSLLDLDLPVRVVVRDAAKGAAWAAQGAEVALADIADAGALTRAFTGVDAVFILLPPQFDPSPGYPEARAIIDAVAIALAAARPARVVCLSTIGADAAPDNLLRQLTLMEQALAGLGLPITFLRAAWFMENAAWDVARAREAGLLPNYLQPAGKPFPMVATRDVGRFAARLMQEEWAGLRIVELEGPARISPDHLARAFATALGRQVRVETVARSRWECLFRAQGMANPLPRCRMLDGFNEGWIDFRDQGRGAIKGTTTIEDVVAGLVGGAA